MAMKDRHTPDDGGGEVQNDIHGTAIRNINRVQPRWHGEWRAVLCIGQEVNLVNVKRMQFAGVVDDTPMLVCTNTSGCHRTRVGRVLLAVDVETVLVLGKVHHKLRCSSL